MDEFDSGDKGAAAPAPAPAAGDDGNSAPLPETVSVVLYLLGRRCVIYLDASGCGNSAALA
jgi:hypothetical protein